MLRILNLLKLVLIFVFVSAVSAQSLDEILENHYDAIGQDKLSDKKTYKIEMTIHQGGMEIPLTVMGKRPLKVRSEVSFQGMKQITTFDGEIGWTINPFMGMTEPQQMTEDQILQIKEQADIDGDLVNYKEKGYTVELVGDDEVDGIKVHKIKVSKPNGNVTTHYMDAENYVIIKSISIVNNQGTETEVESFMSDYRPVDGIIFPFEVEVKSGGQTMMKTVMTNIEFGIDVPDSVFGKPATESKPETSKEEKPKSEK